jgi:hypothetical protein
MFYTNPDKPTTWAGVQFPSSAEATVLRVKIIPATGRDRAHPYTPSGPSCTCCYWGLNEKVDLGGFNVRATLGNHLVDDGAPGVSFVTGMATHERRIIDFATGEHKSYYMYPFSWDAPKTYSYDITKPILMVRLESGHIVTSTEDGHWCPYLMQESACFKGLLLSFQGCALDIETLTPSQTLTQRLVAGARGYIASIANSPATFARLDEEAHEKERWRARKAEQDAAAAAAAAARAIADAAAAAAAAQELIDAPIRAAAAAAKAQKDREDFAAAMEAAKEEDF